MGFGAADTITVGSDGAATSATFTVGTKTLDKLANYINKDDTLHGGTVNSAESDRESRRMAIWWSSG